MFLRNDEAEVYRKATPKHAVKNLHTGVKKKNLPCSPVSFVGSFEDQRDVCPRRCALSVANLRNHAFLPNTHTNRRRSGANLASPMHSYRNGNRVRLPQRERKSCTNVGILKKPEPCNRTYGLNVFAYSTPSNNKPTLSIA